MSRNWKKYTAVIVAAVGICSALLTGCGAKRNELKIGFDIEFPPYSYQLEDGEYTGFDIELAKAVCELNGWEAEFVPISWDEKKMDLEQGKIDCIWGGFTITGREEEYTLSIPCCTTHHVIVVRDDSEIMKLDDLKGKVVGVQAAASSSEYLQNDSRGREMAENFGLLSQFSDFNAVFESLKERSLDAVIADVGISEYYVRNSSGELRILDETVLSECYGVAFKKGDNKLCEEINKSLQELYKKGKVREIAEKYNLEDTICIR